MNVNLLYNKINPILPWEIVSIMVATSPQSFGFVCRPGNFECFLNKVAGKVANALKISKKNVRISNFLNGLILWKKWSFGQLVLLMTIILRKLYFQFLSHWMGYDRHHENCHHDHIPFNLKGNGNIVFSVYICIYICSYLLHSAE